MDTKHICKRYNEYLNCRMSKFELERELVLQKMLFAKYSNDVNLIFISLISLIPINTAVYVSDYLEYHKYITGSVVICGFILVGLYKHVKSKQIDANLNVHILSGFKRDLVNEVNRFELNAVHKAKGMQNKKRSALRDIDSRLTKWRKLV